MKRAIVTLVSLLLLSLVFVFEGLNQAVPVSNQQRVEVYRTENSYQVAPNININYLAIIYLDDNHYVVRLSTDQKVNLGTIESIKSEVVNAFKAGQ